MLELNLFCVRFSRKVLRPKENYTMRNLKTNRKIFNPNLRRLSAAIGMGVKLIKQEVNFEGEK
jgi:hypothetical protein